MQRTKMIGLSDRQSSGIPLPVLARAAPGIFLEHAREMTGQGKAEIGADHGERYVRIAEEAFGLLRFFLQDEVSYIFPRYPP